ncbi:MAG: hypothetical protein AAGA62_08655 [Bacteroidota bacterium]
MNTNQLGYDEVVDTLADSITVYRKISAPLRDGFQFPDLLSLYEAYPYLVEIYEDRRTFAAQFIDLTADETLEVLQELSLRTDVPRDKVEQVAFRAFSVAGRTYRLVRHTLSEVQDIREEAALIFRTEQGEGVGLLNPAA